MPEAWPLLAETAQLFELAGLAAEAADLALDAWSRGGPASLLVKAMRLMLAMGDLDAYAAAAERALAVPGLDPLASLRDLLEGRVEEARHAAARILAASEDPHVRRAAAWSLFCAARAGGTSADLAEAAARLAELFPGSPEASIALTVSSGTGSRVAEAPSPALFSAGPAPSADAGPPEMTSEKTWSVQAGAFHVRENADELVRDLSRAGFEPVIREAAVQGRTVFRVYAAAGLDRDAAARALERLEDAGYAGIIVGD